MDGLESNLSVAETEKPRAQYLRQYELVDKVKAYHPETDEDLLNAAYVFTVAKHGEQLRASGDPYFSHPVAVAGLLADLRLDQNTIVAGLLHDTVEDTGVTLQEIDSRFGSDIAELVNGVTKLTRLEYTSEETKQAENFRKFILATTNDVRVLLVKLADRLHNMRTLHFIKKEEKRRRIARETMEIYAPLAHIVGVYSVATELEDLAFAQMQPEEREFINKRLKEIMSSNADDIEIVKTELEALLVETGIEGRVKGRRKQPYSIWRKLERQSISFGEVADIFAFRLILNNVDDCYKALGALHLKWHCLPNRFRDFISVPKPNGYRSLHTTVQTSKKRKAELQIRTEEMHDTAENGVAAHWAYKNQSYGFDREGAKAVGLDATRALNAFGDLLENTDDPQLFMQNAKLEMYRNHVFVLTPKGRVVMLPDGAMPLDFAYAVHTAIGDTCTGVIINGQKRSLRTKLKNGDVVEVVRSKDAVIKPGWESLTVTGRARSAIGRLIRADETAEFERLGHHMLSHAIRRIGVDPIELDLDETAAKAGFETRQALAVAIGRGRFSTKDVLKVAFPGYSEHEDVQTNRVPIEQAAPLFVRGAGLTQGVTIHFAQCCSPLPGERIVGVLRPDQGVEVHTVFCNRLAEFEDEIDNWIDLKWTGAASEEAIGVVRIKVSAANNKGVLATLCSAVAHAEGNIIGVKTGERAPDFIDLYFDIEVADVKHHINILAAFRSLAVVDTAERVLESDFDDG